VPYTSIVGIVGGAVAAVVVQRIQLARFATHIDDSNGVDWIDTIPVSLGALRTPLRAIDRQLSQRSEALSDATARDRLREVTLDAVEMERDALDRALGDSRQDMAEVLEALDRALASSSPQAILRRELVELRELVRLNVFAELPSESVALGDIVADVVEGGVERGRVSISGNLPVVAAPVPLVEALVRSLLGHALSCGEGAVTIRGARDAAMTVIEIDARHRAEPTIHMTKATRAANILGGRLAERPDGLIVVFPSTFMPNLRAVTSGLGMWDLPEAM
jgi:hypothetical protein